MILLFMGQIARAMGGGGIYDSAERQTERGHTTMYAPGRPAALQGRAR